MCVVAIDFTLSDSQQELQKNAKAFAEGVLRPVAGQIDRAADGWESFLAGREAYREMAHAGFTKSFIPVEYGGAGFTTRPTAPDGTRPDASCTPWCAAPTRPRARTTRSP